MKKPPIELSKRGQEIWKVKCLEYEESGSIDNVNLFLLAQFCDTVAEYEELNKFRNTNDNYLKLKSQKGHDYYAKHPNYIRLEKLDSLLLRLNKQLEQSATKKNKSKIQTQQKGHSLFTRSDD